MNTRGGGTKDSFTRMVVDPARLRMIGDRVLIAIKPRADMKPHGLALPERSDRAVFNNERQGVVYAVGPQVDDVKPGDWCHFLRASSASLIRGGEIVNEGDGPRHWIIVSRKNIEAVGREA